MKTKLFREKAQAEKFYFPISKPTCWRSDPMRDTENALLNQIKESFKLLLEADKKSENLQREIIASLGAVTRARSNLVKTKFEREQARVNLFKSFGDLIVELDGKLDLEIKSPNSIHLTLTFDPLLLFLQEEDTKPDPNPITNQDENNQ